MKKSEILMERMNKEQLNDILEKHKKWLEGEEGGERANLIGAHLTYTDLRYVNLKGADLRSAALSHTDLGYANLKDTDLRYADLSYTDLTHTDLSYANLRSSDLRSTNLTGTDLSGAHLSYANLKGTDLKYVNLRSADLRSADLSHSDLSHTDLRHTNLTGTDLSGAHLSYANLDFSGLPLGCGSLSANFDDRQLIQIAYHLVKAGINSNNASAETKKELRKLTDFANKFHRVEECGRIKKEVEE